ncbi:MAG: 3D domain-containing protein [Peptostreptococcaceae bacterium]
MNLKNNKIIKVLGLTGILSIGILSGYKELNKEVTLMLKGEERTVSIFKPNVKENKEEQKIKYNNSDIVKKGTEVETQMSLSRGISSRVQVDQLSNNSNKTMSVVATAYTGDSITSTGTTPKWGTIAVDPNVIPYGTEVYIPQFDMIFIAEDTGSSIKENKIDIYMQDEVKVKKWGRKTIEIYIIG